MAARKQRTITAAMLDALERQCQAEYDTEMKHNLRARQAIGGDTQIRRAQLDRHETVCTIEHAAQVGIIHRLRFMLTDDESAVA